MLYSCGATSRTIRREFRNFSIGHSVLGLLRKNEQLGIDCIGGAKKECATRRRRGIDEGSGVQWGQALTYSVGECLFDGYLRRWTGRKEKKEGLRVKKKGGRKGAG